MTSGLPYLACFTLVVSTKYSFLAVCLKSLVPEHVDLVIRGAGRPQEIGFSGF